MNIKDQENSFNRRRGTENQNCERTEHNRYLDDIRPDNRLDAAECVVKVARGISLFASTEERCGDGLRRKD
jgi:hypothetical protein